MSQKQCIRCSVLISVFYYCATAVNFRTYAHITPRWSIDRLRGHFDALRETGVSQQLQHAHRHRQRVRDVCRHAAAIRWQQQRGLAGDADATTIGGDSLDAVWPMLGVLLALATCVWLGEMALGRSLV